MAPKRIAAKLYVNEQEQVDLPGLIPVFHGWIQEKKVDGLPIDVADYKHVVDGPGVLLVGHEGDYALDGANGRFGLRYDFKREWPHDTLAGRLHIVLQRLLHGAHLLAEDADLTVNTAALQLVFLDRLRTPNTAATLAAVRDDIEAVLKELFAGGPVSLAWVEADERRPFTLDVTIPHAPPLEQVLERVGKTAVIA